MRDLNEKELEDILELSIGVRCVRCVKTKHVGDTTSAVGLDALVLVQQYGLVDQVELERIERFDVGLVLIETFKALMEGLVGVIRQELFFEFCLSAHEAYLESPLQSIPCSRFTLLQDLLRELKLRQSRL